MPVPCLRRRGYEPAMRRVPRGVRDGRQYPGLWQGRSDQMVPDSGTHCPDPFGDRNLVSLLREIGLRRCEKE